MADTKPDKPEQPPRADEQVRQSEFRRMIEEYAADLREIIRKLRKKLH